MKVTLKGTIENHEISQNVELAPHETKHVTAPELTMEHPRLWWPTHVGPQNLYDLHLAVIANGAKSDEDVIHFGDVARDDVRIE